MALPTGSGHTFDEVGAVATGPNLVPAHFTTANGITEEYLPLLKPAGFSALVLTVDVKGPFPMIDALLTTPSIPSKSQVVRQPAEQAGTSRTGTKSHAGNHPNITWERLDWLRELSGGLPLVLKGVRRADDAQTMSRLRR